jgi:hypothetical protein
VFSFLPTGRFDSPITLPSGTAGGPRVILCEERLGSRQAEITPPLDVSASQRQGLREQPGAPQDFEPSRGLDQLRAGSDPGMPDHGTFVARTGDTSRLSSISFPARAAGPQHPSPTTFLLLLPLPV